ncbi:hypothetical protein J3R30DRAFT_3406678 [Lentinula aciculospora]|uniref:Uncharacterized protein n=1 Tax=Lentinula aciculospora TaxID=153920 RepID=A0A9W9DKW1_9AGAR|nr:hypothetical protein J3R30DRAFT_3406678 [Lentinula aciculospora]
MRVLSTLHILVLISGIVALPMRIDGSTASSKTSAEPGPPSWRRDLVLTIPSLKENELANSVSGVPAPPSARNEADQSSSPTNWSNGDDSGAKAVPPSWERSEVRQNASPGPPSWKRDVSMSIAAHAWGGETS